MVENPFKFQHDVENIPQALGLSKEVEHKCIEMIIFSTISNLYLAEELFDDLKDAPKSLTTLTGDLEKALSLCSNELEKSYMLFMFKQVCEICKEMMAKQHMLNKMTGVDKEKAELLFKLLDLKVDEHAKEQETEAYLTPSMVLNRMKMVKKSRYDFQKYLSLLNNNDNNIDDILKKVFGDDD